ncbi:MAG: YicC family protein [Bacteroidales bacterium]|nr:YicC family protein [Bacteroidales bacterium]
MIRSMTGYGKAEAQLENGKLTVEIRSLNAKSADINIKSTLLPKDKDLIVRRKLAERLQRGTIDVFFTFEASADGSARQIPLALVKNYLAQLQGVSEYKGEAIDAALLGAVLRFPDVTDTKKEDIITDANWPVVEKAIDAALDAIENYRLTEGAALEKDVTGRVNLILSLYDEVESLEGERIEAVRGKLLKSLEELQLKPNPERFEQELIYYLEKYDINEEKVRLRQHCKYFMETLSSEPYPGKKLGFIIQEMGREINTTGSKANHAGIQQLVVRMKDELEKIREQSMNIL